MAVKEAFRRAPSNVIAWDYSAGDRLPAMFRHEHPAGSYGTARARMKCGCPRLQLLVACTSSSSQAAACDSLATDSCASRGSFSGYPFLRGFLLRCCHATSLTMSFAQKSDSLGTCDAEDVLNQVSPITSASVLFV